MQKKVSVLVSKIFGLKKSLGIGLKNSCLKKSLTIGLQRFGLKKFCNGLEKSIGISHISNTSDTNNASKTSASVSRLLSYSLSSVR